MKYEDAFSMIERSCLDDAIKDLETQGKIIPPTMILSPLDIDNLKRLGIDVKVVTSPERDGEILPPLPW